MSSNEGDRIVSFVILKYAQSALGRMVWLISELKNQLIDWLDDMYVIGECVHLFFETWEGFLYHKRVLIVKLDSIYACNVICRYDTCLVVNIKINKSKFARNYFYQLN